MEHFRCRHAVDILRLAVRLDQVFIARHMGQHAELNLGIVGIQKDTARLWHEGFPDQTAKLHPHRNVLQIRIGTADAAGRGDGLVKCRMDSSIFPDHGLQTVGVRRFQFGKLAVLQNIGNKFVIRCELFRAHRRQWNNPSWSFLPPGSCSFSNRITPSCFGELMLNSSPASS